MNMKSLILSALIAIVLIALLGCGDISELPYGVISGVDEITVSDYEIFSFYYRNRYYGYIEFSKYLSQIRIKAPYGICVSSLELDSAPVDNGNNYLKHEIIFEFGKYYYFKPDSNIYGKIIKLQEEGLETLKVKFEYYIQTERGVRDLWIY